MDDRSNWRFVPPYFAIPMPVNENGEGPVTDGTHARIIWQVWDDCNCTVSEHETQHDAVEAAAAYNERDSGGT